MWQRFTERARKIVFNAQEEAQHFGEGYVSTEHILLGLCRETDSLAAVILKDLGVSLDAIRKEVERQLPRGEARPNQDMTLTPRAKRVIDLAYDEARELHNNYIGSEHLLLGLIREGDGLAGRALHKLGVDLESARRVTLERQDGEKPSEPRPLSFTKTLRERFGFGRAGPTLRFGAPLPVHYDLQTLHPVDQILLALLSDADSELGKNMRDQCRNLEVLLPSVVASMSATARHGRLGIQGVINEAQLMAVREKRHELKPEDLFLACVRHTTDDVREVLAELSLNPFGPEDIPGSE